MYSCVLYTAFLKETLVSQLYALDAKITVRPLVILRFSVASVPGHSIAVLPR
jgi:hypothetical protein